MLLIRKTALVIFTVVMIAAVAGTAAGAFVVLKDAAYMSADETKLVAEDFLFAGIVISTITSVFFIILAARSRNINKTLDRMLRQREMDPDIGVKGFEKLGATGGKLKALFQQITDISEKRELKISAQGRLIRLLSLNLEIPVIITDITGQIIHASEKYKLLPEMNIHELEENIEIEPLLQDFQLGVQELRTGTKKKFKCIPVYSKDQVINYLIFMPANSKINLPPN